MFPDHRMREKTKNENNSLQFHSSSSQRRHSFRHYWRPWSGLPWSNLLMAIIIINLDNMQPLNQVHPGYWNSSSLPLSTRVASQESSSTRKPQCDWTTTTRKELPKETALMSQANHHGWAFSPSPSKSKYQPRRVGLLHGPSLHLSGIGSLWFGGLMMDSHKAYFNYAELPILNAKSTLEYGNDLLKTIHI